MDQMTEVGELLKPAITALITQLKETEPAAEHGGASYMIATNMWWEVEKKLRAEFERDLNVRAREFRTVVETVANEIWESV